MSHHKLVRSIFFAVYTLDWDFSIEKE